MVFSNRSPIANYFFEAGMLKRICRSGWWSENVATPESVADHVFRTAVVAFVLAKLEGCDAHSANRICTAAVFHDMHETRILDLNKITARYIDVTREIELKVEREQVNALPQELSKSILDALTLTGKEQVILKDADYLECAVQAKEYADIGHKTKPWLESISKRLKTKSAKMILREIASTNSTAWKDGLKRFREER